MKGTEVVYNGRKYVFLRDLCRELELAYSQVVHKYYRTKDIDESVEWAKRVQVRKEKHILWGRHYETLNDAAKTFGLNVSSLRARIQDGKTLEEAAVEMLQKGTIMFNGREYAGITSLAAAYGHDVALISDRLVSGMTLERAVGQQVRVLNRPELEIEYHGKKYAGKRQLSREIGISTSCIHEMMVNNDIEIETAVDILFETKERAGIPKETMISGLPVCIIDGKRYETVKMVAHEFHLSASSIASYKHRHGCIGILETLHAMQNEVRESYAVDGKARTYNVLMKMGYNSVTYKQIPKIEKARYPQLDGKDFVNNCVDVMKIYRKQERRKMRAEETLQFMMDFYPELFPSRKHCPNHLFCSIGNGYDWRKGELVDRDCEFSKRYRLAQNFERAKPRNEEHYQMRLELEKEIRKQKGDSYQITPQNIKYNFNEIYSIRTTHIYIIIQRILKRTGLHC